MHMMAIVAQEHDNCCVSGVCCESRCESEKRRRGETFSERSVNSLSPILLLLGVLTRDMYYLRVEVIVVYKQF